MKLSFGKIITPNFINVEGFEKFIPVARLSRTEVKEYFQAWKKAFLANYNKHKKLNKAKIVKESA